jgi:hypothetical protein
MCTRLYQIATGATVVAILLCAAPVRAQSEEAAVTGVTPPVTALTPAVGNHPEDRRTSLRVLLAAQAAIHSADMITTVSALRHGNVREANPLLRPFAARPVALVAVSSGINVLQMYTVAKLHRRHPKIARAWSLILMGVEAYAVSNNLRVAGRIRQQAAAAGR